MSGTTRIREACIADVPVLATLGRKISKTWFAEVYTDSELLEFLDRDFSEDVLSNHIQSPESHTYLIHEWGDDPVGFARINWGRPIPLTDETGAELQKIYYLPGHTGKGLGRALMTAVTEAVAARAVSSLWLDVLNSNPRARSFYLELGFEVIGDKPFATGRGEIGMQVMRKRLG
ncbi:MAG: GNAT family N-acetyltransferase [Gammaproteobacteria bacterium]|nr:GNAT family N-acetyltransferase [Gammaproteobacteria bacterium]